MGFACLLGLWISITACSGNQEQDGKGRDTPAIEIKLDSGTIDEGDTLQVNKPARLSQEVSSEPEPVDSFPLKVLLGKISPSRDTAFVKVAAAYTNKSSIYLRKATYEAFKEMHAAAKQDGVNLTIVSAMRTFGHQKGIWERKWTGATRVGGKNLSQSIPNPVERALKILEYSSMPGTSRHHWGTDIDLNNLNNSWFASGTGKKVYDWLTANAGNFGFCQTYTVQDETRPDGYHEEKWHWSYMPLAARLLKAYLNQVDYTKITGFKGSGAAEEIDVIPKYVAGIGPLCRNWK